MDTPLILNFDFTRYTLHCKHRDKKFTTAYRIIRNLGGQKVGKSTKNQLW